MRFDFSSWQHVLPWLRVIKASNNDECASDTESSMGPDQSQKNIAVVSLESEVFVDDEFKCIERAIVEARQVGIVQQPRKLFPKKALLLLVVVALSVVSTSLLFFATTAVEDQGDPTPENNSSSVDGGDVSGVAATPSPTIAPTLSPTPAMTEKVLEWKDFKGLLINAGSEHVHTDYRGNEWVGDSNGAIVSSGLVVESEDCGRPINGSAIDDTLFCVGRVEQPSFMVKEIPDGPYVVTMHFTYPTKERKQFEIFINKVRVYKELESQSVKAFAAQSIDVMADVKQGFMQIDFDRLQTSPRVHAIEIHKRNTNEFGTGGVNVTYIPGLLSTQQTGIILSEGLEVRRLATAKQRIRYVNGELSKDRFHEMPDAGSTFVDTRPGNEGGWVYVSNAEVRPSPENALPGGVGAITFNRDGDVIDFRRILSKTRANCGGGRTPWNTWISCEEIENGKIYQVDPLGLREPERITMGEQYSGLFESFGYDNRDPKKPHFFVTKDEKNGELRRFTPSAVDESGDQWSILTGNGTLDYLVITPTPNSDNRSGTFRWSPDRQEGSENAELYFPNTEGIDVYGNELFFVSKVEKRLVILDLDSNTYVFRTTESGLMNGQPDQIKKVSGKDHNIIYFTEDGGQYAGIHGRGYKGQFFTIAESHRYSDETTGLSFSPDYKHLYVAYQDNGLLFDIKRIDGQSFKAIPLNVKYHNDRFSLSNK